MLLRIIGYLLSYRYSYLGPYNTQYDKIPINQIDLLAFEHDILYQFNNNIQEIDLVYARKFIRLFKKEKSILSLGVGIIFYIKYYIEKYVIKIYP